MKLHEIVGEHQEKAKALFKKLNLANTLSLRYQKEEGCCPLQIPAKIEYIDAPGRNFRRGRLHIYINTSQPEIRILQGRHISLSGDEKYLGSYIYKGVMIELENETIDDSEFMNAEFPFEEARDFFLNLTD